MRLTESVVEGVDVFALQGEIDLYYAPGLRSRLQSKVKGRCRALILDLNEVSYIDSTGLATIIEYFRDAAEYGGIVCLAGLNETLKSIFEIVRLDKAMPIFETTAEATAALKQGTVLPPEESLFNRSIA